MAIGMQEQERQIPVKEVGECREKTAEEGEG
jgi:hypothetical protein